MMLRWIRHSYFGKIFCVFTIVILLSEIIFPTVGYALTSGPSQPEVQSFQPIGVTEMVDPFSGDFSYNIPLVDVGGYPINMVYNSGITMDQEASWVGLGWNINPGVINRTMRGLPDDFSNETVTKEMSIKDNWTIGAQYGLGIENLGKSNFGLSYSLGVNYNNYQGIGFEQSLTPSFSAGKMGKEGPNLHLGVSFTANYDGLTLSPNVSLSQEIEKTVKDFKGNISGGVGVKINSRQGLKSITLNAGTSFYNPTKTNTRNKDYRDQIGINGTNGGSTISLVDNTYMPQMDFSRSNTSISLSAKWPTTLFGNTITNNILAYFSRSGLRYKSENLPAYGFIYSEKGYTLDAVMLDFNREKDASFTRSTPNLPVTNFTYDAYAISGQGIGGMFRPFRNDIGYVHDNYVNTVGGGGSLGIELGTGNSFHIGADIDANLITGHSGMWKNKQGGDLILDKIPFTGTAPNDAYENFYFKLAGEKNIDEDPGYYTTIKTTEPVRVGYSVGPGFNSYTTNQLIPKYSSSATTLSTLTKRFGGTSTGIRRIKRNTPVSYLTKKEVPAFGVEGHISPHASEHHIAEYSVIRTDGARYIYGISAYNTKQKDVTFSVKKSDGDCKTGLVTYTSTDASSNNKKGEDNFYSADILPPFAHSYLLTAVLSADYEDVDAIRGPSEKDLGSYTKFNYDADVNSPGEQPSIYKYAWRTPYQQDKAYYNEGLKSKTGDEKGSYIYGEKELWYMKTIETKTHIAVFHTSLPTHRRDGFESAGETGGRGSESMLKLDSISLYSLPDYKANPSTAIPIKRVHFRYDYSLCPNVPNNDGAPVDIYGNTVAEESPSNINSAKGKLTLTKVFFTYQSSYKGTLASYDFTYGDSDHNGGVDNNPAYDLKGYDRWGFYKPQPSTTSCDIAGTTNPMTTAEYPYVDQLASSATDVNKQMASWALTDIKLPSGGKIQLDYESDDYAFVQDKSAMQMLKITAAGNDPANNNPATNGNSLYTGQNTWNNYLYFLLPAGVTSTTELKDKALSSLVNTGKPVYFRFMTGLSNQLTSSTSDYVSGYFEIEDAGKSTVDGNYGWVKIKATAKESDNNSSGNDFCNPIAKSAWNFARIHNQRLAYNMPDPSNGNTMQDVLQHFSSASIINNIINLFQGPNSDLRARNYGKFFDNQKSWIRVYNANGKKRGGGSRVKEIRVYDNWHKMDVNYSNNNAQAVESFYGQQFEYTLPNGESSGVAAYEPIAGGDENVFKQPRFFTTKHLWAPDDIQYMEEPFGESFFPTPNVGYGKVKVKDLPRTNVTKHATGHTIHEFYTAKDFPTIVDETTLKATEQKSNGLGKLLNIHVKDYMTTSQGYVIELNDMHGKPKAQWVYAQGQTTPISGVEYKYNTVQNSISNSAMASQYPNNNANTYTDRLYNKVHVITKDNLVELREVGLDVDMVTDFRESVNKVRSVSLQGNLVAFIAAMLPVAVPTIYPSYSQENTRFRSVVATKVINRYGILKETIAYDLGSKVSTENLAWDAETGEVLLTKTKNNFNDPIYNFTYPAHWGYDRMGAAYRNLRFVMSATISSGAITPSGAVYVTKGDEVIVLKKFVFGNFYYAVDKAWIWDDNENLSDGFILIDAFGNAKGLTGSGYYLQVIRSGRRNLQNMSMGSITCMTNPLKDGTDPDQLVDHIEFVTGDGILNASTTEFSEKWGLYCDEVHKNFPNTCKCDLDISNITQFNNILNYVMSNGLFCSDGVDLPAQYFQNVYDDCVTSAGQYLSSVKWEINPGSSCTTQPYSTFFNPVGSLNGSSDCNAYIDCITTFTPYNPATSSQGFPSGCNWSNLQSLQIVDVYSLTSCSTGVSVPGKAYAVFVNGSTIYNWLVKVENTCFPFGNCTNPGACTTLTNKIINPYLQNVRGQWRPLKSHVYQVNRDQTLVTVPSSSPALDNTSIRADGKFNSFSTFWTAPSVGNDWGTNATGWTWTSEIQKYSPYGFEIENKDALNRFSAAIYGYSNTLPKAVASNAAYNEIAFDGFEDYDFLTNDDCCNGRFNFLPYVMQRSTTTSHSGRYSMKLLSGGSSNFISITRDLITAPCSVMADQKPYRVKPCDIYQEFAPAVHLGTKDFVVSYWVKQPKANNAKAFDFPDIVLKVYNNANLLTPVTGSVQRSAIIDGWQRVEERYSVLGSYTGTIKVELINTNGTAGNDAYVDDLRIQPFNSSMKSFVYDPQTLRLWAELDERNFATFYEYDEDGALIRVKKETEKGIMTIQESRNNISK